tara:strand:- start:16 stop:792 length:777 start_codon:yes stop_codon:yes gene_type:complete
MKYYNIIIFSIIILYLISTFSFKNGKPTCNNFVINTYLYLAFSICFLGIIINIFHKTFFNNETKYIKLIQKLAPYFILLFIISLVLIFYISSQPTFNTSTTYIFQNHLLWLLFVSIIGFIMTPRVTSKETEQYIDDVIYIVAGIFIMMSSLVYLFPYFFEKTFNFMYIGLLISLIFIIIIEIINYFITQSNNQFIKNRRIISYIVIIIFSLYVSYDTKKIINLSNICVNYPNYPKLSVSFFLDVINLFSRILFLQSNK